MIYTKIPILKKLTGINVSDHFAEVSKMIKVAKGAKRKVQDYMLADSNRLPKEQNT